MMLAALKKVGLAFRIANPHTFCFIRIMFLLLNARPNFLP